MHIAFLSNPASGQVNVQMATAQKLVSEGHRVTFLSGDSCVKKIDQLRDSQPAFQQNLIDFVGLGSSHNVSD
jgi:UDP:flavonoid glycosyltransferase YjiC (YdhE family)